MEEVLLILIVVLVVSLIITISELVRYRWQIREVCRQLSFHQSEKSNQEIRLNVQGRDFKKLQGELNRLFLTEREWLKEYQKADDNLKNMITNISHDIRTPLTSIDGYFQLLCISENEIEKEKYSNIIRGRLKSLGSLLEQLFTFVRVQNSTFTVNLEVLDIKQLLCENLFSFYEEFKLRGIEPEVSIPEEPCFAYLDKQLIPRVLQNILKNALVHGQGEVMVSLVTEDKRINIQIMNQTDEEHPEDASQVFERFFQGDKSRNQQSAGLGLCIAKELVEKMNGKIHAFYECKNEQNYFGIEISFEEMRITDNGKDTGN